MSAHPDTGSATEEAAAAATEDRRGFDQVCDIETCALGDIFRRKRFNRSGQTVETLDIILNEFMIEGIAGNQDAQDAGQIRRVLTRAHLEMHMRPARAFGFARFDHNQLGTALDQILQPLRRVLGKILF